MYFKDFLKNTAIEHKDRGKNSTNLLLIFLNILSLFRIDELFYTV